MQKNENVSCGKYSDMLFDYVSDNLTSAEKDELLLHINSCPHCRSELCNIQAIISATSQLGEVDVPDGLKASVFEQVEKYAKASSDRKIALRRVVATFGPLAASVVIAIGIFSGGFYDKFIKSDELIKSAPVKQEQPLIQAEITEKPVIKEDKQTSAPKTVNSMPEAPVAPAEEAPTQEPAQSTPFTIRREAPSTGTIEEPVIEGRIIEQENGISVASETPLTEDVATGTPYSCVVITHNPVEFAKGYGKNEVSFEVSVDSFEEFINYTISCGAEYTLEYSDTKVDFVKVTVKEK